MYKTLLRVAPVLILVVLLIGCKLPQAATPTTVPGLAETQAAQTVSAVLTASAPTATQPAPASPTLPPDTPTNTVPPATPTNTPRPTTAVTTVPCNAAKFIQDVNIPDGTAFAPGTAFTKTWRVQNVGSCTWTSGYQLIFDKNDKMGGPTSQPLTTGTVAPLQMLDISVDLTAPATAGTYRGYWKFRDPNDNIFILTSGLSLWVEIKVTNPATTVTLNYVDADGGSIRSDGSVMAGLPNLGDLATNVSSQVFLSFDISGIPDGSVVSEVKLDFSSGYDILGNPFGGLDCFRVYADNYGSLDAGDFVLPLPAGHMSKLCSTTDLNTVQVDNDYKITLQARIGTSHYQIRLQFEINTDSDGVADMVRFGIVKLIVTYSAP